MKRSIKKFKIQYLKFNIKNTCTIVFNNLES